MCIQEVVYKYKVQYYFPLYLGENCADNTGDTGWCLRITPEWDTKQIGTYLNRNILIAYCNFMLLKRVCIWSLVISAPDLAHKILLQVFIQLVFKRREFIEANEVYSSGWLFFPPHVHQFYISVIPLMSVGLFLIYTKVKKGRILSLLFLSVF